MSYDSFVHEVHDGIYVYKKLKYNNLSDLYQDKKNDIINGIGFIGNREKEKFVSFSELYYNSLTVLYNLQKQGIKPNDELVFQIDDNETFVYVFWACILGGIKPVPLTIARKDEHWLKLIKVCDVLNHPFFIMNKDQSEPFRGKFKNKLNSISKRIIFANDINKGSGAGDIHKVSATDIAFIQFSSGSTGDPKGVVLTHENLLTNIESILKSIQIRPTDSSLSWMPLTHDMGLIGFHLTPLAVSANHYLVPTHLFINDPLIWMDKIQEHRVTITGSPNFGYKLFSFFFNLGKPAHLDLSCVRIIFNGAEPISYEVSNDFLNEMGKYGLKRNTIYPVYGMAEACLAVTFPPVEEEIKPVIVNRNFLNMGENVRYGENNNNDNLTLIDLGFPVDNTEIKILDDRKNPLPEEVVGNLYIKGKNVTKGYYNNLEATRENILDDGWLNTGDIGFIKNGRLIITGRTKDIIFLNGTNYYSHDIERLAEGVEMVAPGSVVAVGIPLEETKEDTLVIFHRNKDNDLNPFLNRADKIIKHISMQTGLKVDQVIPVSKIHRTTSGKLQRFKMVEEFLNGKYDNAIQDLIKLQHHVIVENKSNAPQNDTEKKIIKITSEVLSINPDFIQADANFFELGCNSLKLTILLSYIEKLFHIKIPIRFIFENPTIEAMAEYISTHTDTDPIQIIPAEKKEYYPISSAQKRLLFMSRFNEVGTSYNNIFILRLKGKIDKERLENSFRGLIERHEVLRTSFEIIDDEPVQRIHDNVDLSIPFIEGREEDLPGMMTDFIK
ncbi:MAG: AMP-binding protein, partial [Proteobacteria bacterium]|nr:AMP-binding protein [Pseudomonadota bacterium]